MSARARVDPWRTVRYLLEWDGLVQAGFSEVTVPDTVNRSNRIQGRQ